MVVYHGVCALHHTPEKPDVNPCKVATHEGVADDGPPHQLILGMHQAWVLGVYCVWVIAWVALLFKNSCKFVSVFKVFQFMPIYPYYFCLPHQVFAQNLCISFKVSSFQIDYQIVVNSLEYRYPFFIHV